MEIIKILLITIMSGIVFRLSLSVIDSKKDIKNNFLSKIDNASKKSKIGYFSYEKIDLMLNQYGIYHMFPNITPSHYILIKLGSGMLLSLIGIREKSLLLGIILFVIGFYMVDMFVNISNKSDNKVIMYDVKIIYDTLSIQAQTGVYITTSLAESYYMIRNKRLKSAILELTNNILAKNDLEESLESFNMKFKNEHIDTLCIIIKQSLKTGQKSKMLKDIGTQLTSIQHSTSLKEKERLKYKNDLIKILVLIGLIAICIYCLGNEFINSIIDF